MDRFCCMVVVIGAVVLIALGCSEFSRLQTTRSSSTCGMQAQVDAKSAKKAHVTRKPVVVEDFAPVVPDEPSQPFDELVHPSQVKQYAGQPQDDTALQAMFTNTPSENEAEFRTIDPQKAKDSITKKVYDTTAAPEPRFNKQLGVENTMLSIFHRATGSDVPKMAFTEGDICFNSSEMHAAAKARTQSA